MFLHNIRNKINAILNFKENWKLKNPSEKWYWLYDMASIGAELVGVRVFTTNQLTLYSYSTAFIICIYYLSIMNALIHYASEGQIFHGFRGFGVGAIVIPVSENQTICNLECIMCSHSQLLP